MRKLITLLLLAASVQLLAQSYPITSITISLPANPDANTANWGTGTSLFMVSATAKGVYGRIDPIVESSKILVIIKKGGNKICGAYTSGTAPSANFTTLTKVWNGSNATSLIGKDCTLPPGDYEICVQFFGNGAAGATPLSDEKSKAFTIRGTEQQTYQAPQAIMPANGTLFKEVDILKPITFRWTPVVPKPQELVTYRLKVWQLMQGQNGSQAIRTNQPIFTKDVDNLTQATANNIITGPCKPPYLCDFVWNVQALNRDGKPIGGNNGTSEANVFKIIITDPSTGCFKLDTTQYKIICNGYDAAGKPKYKINNLILTNIGTNNGRTGLHNTPVTNYITPTGFTVAALTPLSASLILPGNSINISFEINGATGTTASFVVNSTIIDPTNPNLFCDKTIGVKVDLPNCACNPCKDKQTTFGKDSSNSNNVGQVNTLSTVSHGPNKVIKVTAQIVNFERLGENGCLRCTKDSKEFGNYIGGSLNGNGGIIVKGSYGKQIQWQFNTPTTVSGFSYNLNMMFPPLTDVSCCKDSIRICTRWSFTDEKCIACDTLICKVIVREYKKPTGLLTANSPNMFASQIAKMGEPYTSWYNQKGTELPKNFDEQLNTMYESSSIDNKQILENKPTKEEFNANSVAVFNNIQLMKTTATDAVWNAIKSSTLNSQCDNGNFESGTLDMAQWGGAYGTIPYSGLSSTSTNDVFTRGIYTNGFSPSSVPLNASITTFTNEHSIVSYSNDPVVGSLLKTTSSASNNYSFRLGNRIMNYGTEVLSKKFIVTGNGVIKFSYALVLNEPGAAVDPSYTKSAFRVAVYDVNGNRINNKVYLDAANSSPVDYIPSDATSPFFQVYGTGQARVVYRDWSCAKIDLSGYIGQQISVALITNDCSWGGHYGYAYIDDWCGDCSGLSTGSVNIKPITEPCIDKNPQVCVDYTLPKIGTTTGSGTIKLEFYQNGVLVPGTTLTSPTLTSGTNYCFTINPAKLPCNGKGYDVVATGNFTVGSTPIIVTSPDPVGSPVVGIVAGQNNDLYCCSIPAEICCQNFIKTVTTTTSMVGNATSGYNTIKFVPTFKAGPKPIKKVVISIINFETSSSNKECLTCESNIRNYGTMSVPNSPVGSGGKDAIEGMTYPSPAIIYTCVGCPSTWQTGQLTHEVTWGSNSGAGYDLMDGVGDQSTTFFVHLPKKLTLSCCDDTIKVCVKYSFTDIECKTCDTIICYKVVNRATITTTAKANILGTSYDNKGNRMVKTNKVDKMYDLMNLRTYTTVGNAAMLHKKNYYINNELSSSLSSVRPLWGLELINTKNN